MGPPGWFWVFEYAEQFGAHPQDVAGHVTAEWWVRWQMWRKASLSSQAWTNWDRNKKADEPESMRKARLWAMNKDEY